MKILLFLSSLLLSFSCAHALDIANNCPTAFENGLINYETLEGCMKEEGVLFEVHGIVPMSSMFVVSYRNPQNFFDTVHLSLLGTNSSTREMIKTLKRHDVIRVKGEYESEIRSPQKHIRAQTIDLISSYNNNPSSDPYDYSAIPEDLLKMSHFIGKVHAVYAEGSILVVEYEDLVIPVFVKAPFTSLSKGLFRGDKVEINYTIQSWPRKPTHLNLDESHQSPLKVLRPVASYHDQKVSYTGKLILFPRSPMVLFDVYAIDVDIGDGVMLPHTIINFTDMELFTKAREKLAAAWSTSPNTVRSYRNKLVNDAIEVTVHGTYNMVDPIQANPQIVIDKIEDIVVPGEL